MARPGRCGLGRHWNCGAAIGGGVGEPHVAVWPSFGRGEYLVSGRFASYRSRRRHLDRRGRLRVGPIEYGISGVVSVRDEQTQELMEDFYRLVMNGKPRAEALREAQLTIRAKYPDVVDWGAFICQGDPGQMNAQIGRAHA